MNAAATAPRPRGLGHRTIARWLVLVLLATFVGYAGWREVRKTALDSEPGQDRDSHAFSDRRPALTAAEERFSQALWNIHAEVRSAAVRMTFAGLAYKIGAADAASVRTKVTPLTETFRQAAADLRSLDGPESMEQVRSRYADAVRLYVDASQSMVVVAEDRNDAHLLTAQQMSEQASGILLEVGERLWPGEIKPN